MELHSYALLDSGCGEKLEQFGKIVLIRPCIQALWLPCLSKKIWNKAHARFSRETGWEMLKSLPSSWVISVKGINFKIKPTPFGHLGIFPEHISFWQWIRDKIAEVSYVPRILNLFAYSGGATFAAAQAKAQVCHVDAAKGIVDWAQQNAKLNHLNEAPIRWLVDDARKYLGRAYRRKEQFEGILLDPPTFGRGASKEVFKIERDLLKILKQCIALFSKKPLFLILSCHTPGYTPIVLQQLLEQVTDSLGGKVNGGEMIIKGPLNIPSGAFAKWTL